MFAAMEDTAVWKIQALGEVVGNVQVWGIKITAEDAGLYRLVTALMAYWETGQISKAWDAMDKSAEIFDGQLAAYSQLNG